MHLALPAKSDCNDYFMAQPGRGGALAPHLDYSITPSNDLKLQEVS